MGFRGNKMSNLFEKMLSGDITADRRAAVNRVRNQDPAMRKATSEANKRDYANGTRTFPKGFTFLGRNHDNSNKEAMKTCGPDHWLYGNGHLRAGELNTFYGKNHTDECVAHLVEQALNRKVDQHCDHCDKDFTRQHYKQHHGDNCTQNPNRILKKFIIATHIKTNKTIKGGSMGDPIFKKHGLFVDGIRGCLNGSRESYKDYTFTTNKNRESYKTFTTNTNRKRTKSVMTPKGRFNSLTEAREKLNIGVAALNTLFKKDPKNYYKIEEWTPIN